MPNNTSWYWPDVSGLDGAKGACRSGMWCAIVVAGITALFALVAIAGVKLFPIDGSALLDAALFGGIAFGLSRCSRFAGVAGFVLFLIERIYMIAKVGFVPGALIFGVVLLMGFFNGMRGAFAYNKLQTRTAVPLTSPPFS
jgi:hypothetical protein